MERNYIALLAKPEGVVGYVDGADVVLSFYFSI
jgi:hypothetical protein